MDASAGWRGGDTSADEAARADVDALAARAPCSGLKLATRRGGVQKQRTGGLKMGRRSNGPEGVLKPNSVERMEEPCTSPFPGREFGLSTTTTTTFDIAIADELLSMCRRAVQLCRSFFFVNSPLRNTKQLCTCRPMMSRSAR